MPVRKTALQVLVLVVECARDRAWIGEPGGNPALQVLALVVECARDRAWIGEPGGNPALQVGIEDKG